MSDKSKFEELTRDVDWQMQSLRAYIERGFKAPPSEREKMPPSDLVMQNVLDAYLLLAQKFYSQFKSELKKAYNQTNSKNPPMEKDRVSDAEVPILMQQALDKLSGEWERVYGFIAANGTRKTQKTQKTIEQLTPLIIAAIQDIGFSPASLPVIPQFGTAYSLGFFNYADDFMSLSLPITALQSPWEWTIFWHEIAGQKVRLLLKTRAEFEKLYQELFSEVKSHPEMLSDPNNRAEKKSLEKDYNEMDATIDFICRIIWMSLYSEWIYFSDDEQKVLSEGLKENITKDFLASPDSANPSLTNTKKFFQDLSPLRPKLPILMFSFDDLLADIMDELRKQRTDLVMDRLRHAQREALDRKAVRNDDENNTVMDKLLAAWEEALALDDFLASQKKALSEEGWSADWMKELFEDSFSVKNFDFDFLFIFEDILHRHANGGKGLRHPPHSLRLAMATALKLLDFDTKLAESVTPPEVTNWPVGLSNVVDIETLKKFYPGQLSDNAIAIVWLAARKIHTMHDFIRISYDDTDSPKQVVNDAMKEYRKKTDTSRIIVKKVFDAFAGTNSKLIGKQQMVKARSNAKATPLSKRGYEEKIKNLLNRNKVFTPQPLGYRELLDLSFYDVDFGAETYTNITSPRGGFPSATLLGPPIEDQMGTVIYYSGPNNKKHTTNIQNWNDKAPTQYKLQL